MSRLLREDHGFSLVEMVVTVAVMGLLLAAGLPMASRYSRSSQLRGAVSTLVMDLHQTRSLATMQRRTLQVVVEPDGYVIEQVSSATTLRARTLPRGIQFSGPDTLTFFAWGLTDPADLTLSGAERSRIVHLAANGSVTLE